MRLPLAGRGVLAVNRLHDGKDKSECLPATGARAPDEVLAVEDGLERLRLDAIEGDDALVLQPLAHFGEMLKLLT